MSKLLQYNLKEILDKGCSGELSSLTQEDWELLGYLINKSCETNYHKGVRHGKKSYRGED